MAKTYTARKPGTASIRLDLEFSARDDLRVLAAERGQPMSGVVREAILDLIREWRKKSRKKS